MRSLHPNLARTRSHKSPRHAPVQLEPYETKLATSALRDRVLVPRLQKVLDKYVPAQLTEASFWDNFFSHVDVIKLRVVTDFLQAQEAVRAEQKRKHDEWVFIYDNLAPEMKESRGVSHLAYQGGST